jgi:predicted DNA-binding protein (UPF0251 family)
MNELTQTTGQPFVVGEPDNSGTTLTKREAAERMGVSISTLTRQLNKGLIPGAYKAPGPAGVEWRIPIASIFVIKPYEPLIIKKPETNELAELRAEVESLRVRASVAEQLLERDRQEVDSLRQLLTAALEKVPKALTTGETPTRRKWFKREKKLL